MSLVKLASQKNLPLHQYMDWETLNWIIDNKPRFGCRVKYRLNGSIGKCLRRYVPSKEWFLNPKEIRTIHGLRHLLRVAIFALCLFPQEKKLKKENLVIAAVLHDIRRRGSKADRSHSQRTARWFLDNLIEIKNQFRSDLSRSDTEEIYQVIRYHEAPYKEITAKAEYKKHQEAIDLLKTADALDRYRQPKFKWWINDQYLVSIPSDELKRFAYDLIVASEKIFLRENNDVESVFKALERLQK